MAKSEKQRVALVTGAHEGIGRVVADRLAQTGYRVFGTSRCERPDREGVEMLQLDVRDDHNIRNCIMAIEGKVSQIDLLVSNAGLTVVAPTEEMPIEVAQDMMDVNFYGTARLVNALLPPMRSRRSGHLIFVSSLAGQMGIPGQGYYCATKHALEGYADGLRAEMKQFGIKVTLLEPGHFKTGIIDKSAQPKWPTLNAYDGLRERLREIVTTATNKGYDPKLIADVVVRAAKAPNPRLRYRIDGDGKRAMFFKSLLPESIFYGVVAKRFGM